MTMRLRGFTIIELLVVMIIIGLLLAAVGMNFSNARKAGRDGRRISEILLISNAIDQSAAINRGQYPKNAVNQGDDTTMCADEMATSTNNPNQIDLSIFSNRTIPTDPRPASDVRNCTDYQSGYIYRTNYGNDQNALAYKNQYTYILEVGLEQDKTIDETNFRNTLQETGDGYASFPVTNGPRNVFFYTGKSCGDTCY